MSAFVRRACTVTALAAVGLLTVTGPASAAGDVSGGCAGYTTQRLLQNPYNPVPTATYTPPAGASVNANGTVSYVLYEEALAVWIVVYCDV